MAYKHGVYTSEVETSLTAPIVGTAGLQVIVGTAPVNMLKDPAAAVNVPLLVNNYKEAVEAVGYNDDFEAYTLCECISAAFSVVGVAPMVLINVLDPAKHKADISEKTMQVNDGVAVLDEVGVLLEGLTIKADATPLEAGKDYTTTWNNDGTLNIVLLKGGAGEKATTLTATGSKIDPSKVKAADIVGGGHLLRQGNRPGGGAAGISQAVHDPRHSAGPQVQRGRHGVCCAPGKDQEHQ